MEVYIQDLSERSKTQSSEKLDVDTYAWKGVEMYMS